MRELRGKTAVVTGGAIAAVDPGNEQAVTGTAQGLGETAVVGDELIELVLPDRIVGEITHPSSVGLAEVERISGEPGDLDGCVGEAPISLDALS